MRPGESPTQFGERLGCESKGKPSRFDYVVEEINKAGLTQEQAVEATTAATKAMGLRLVVVRQGPDVILSSVMPGDARPIVIAKPGGQVVRGVADIRIANPPSLDRPIVLENVREGAPGEPPTPNPPEPTPSGTYDPKTRTVEQLALDRDPTPRAGETPEQAQAGAGRAGRAGRPRGGARPRRARRAAAPDEHACPRGGEPGPGAHDRTARSPTCR